MNEREAAKRSLTKVQHATYLVGIGGFDHAKPRVVERVGSTRSNEVLVPHKQNRLTCVRHDASRAWARNGSERRAVISGRQAFRRGTAPQSLGQVTHGDRLANPGNVLKLARGARVAGAGIDHERHAALPQEAGRIGAGAIRQVTIRRCAPTCNGS